MKNDIEFKTYGRYALFSDPITRVGGEKSTYHIPTYEALKGIAKSIYWKPTFIWIIDEVRLIKQIRTQTKGVKPLKMEGGNDLSIYTYLVDVEYQVKAHFEWNEFQKDLEKDRIDGKHFEITKRMLQRGGRQDIFLGTRECQGYAEPCRFGDGIGYYDDVDEVSYGLMFHGFDYPDETGKDELYTRFCRPVMKNGIIKFDRPDECTIKKFVRPMKAKKFGVEINCHSVELECDEMALQFGSTEELL